MKSLSDTILENLRDAVLIINKLGKIVYANKAAAELFGKPANELYKQVFGFPISPNEIQEVEIMKEGKVLIIQMLATSIRWKGKDSCLLSLRDITELKNISKELELQKTILQKTNEDLEQYAYFVSHDLKVPIRKIILFADLMIANRSLDSNPEVKKQLQTILKSAVRMDSLVTEVVEYSKVSDSKEKFVPVNLNEIVRGILSDLDETIEEKQAKIEFNELPTIEAVPIQMHQLFFNLISNSIKYAKKDVPPEISISFSENDAHYEISVDDNGIGFPSELAHKIFQPFQRLHSKEYEGSGIGLAICKKIVECHNGNITVKSSPGEGTNFTITLAKKHLY